MSIDSFEQVVAALAEDPQLRDSARTVEAGVCEAMRGSEGLLFVDAAAFSDATRLAPHLAHARDDCLRLLLVSRDGGRGHEGLLDQREVALLSLPIERSELQRMVRDQLELVSLRRRMKERGRRLDRYRYELGELVTIARAISSERDVVKLLGLILEKCRMMTAADAGSVYIVENTPASGAAAGGQPERTLHFMISQNDSYEMDLRSFTMPVDDRSIVGAAVLGRRVINVSDLETLPPTLHHNKAPDLQTGYQTRSILTVPMFNQTDDVIGVIQLLNKKDPPSRKLRSPEDFDGVLPFTARDEELSSTIASQAGISLENAMLYEDIRQLFDGFVNASVTAIESRDPTTSGHSQRVATLTLGLAEIVDRDQSEAYRVVRFTVEDLKQLEYAALLHDFGKVGVRENVLVKARKLQEWERDLLVARFDYIRKSLEAAHLRRRLAGERVGDEALVAEHARLDELLQFILESNEPTVMPGGSFDRLLEIAEHTYVDERGQSRPYITTDEIMALRVPRGSLTMGERNEIESHVVHTYNFLRTIPWGRQFARIPEIAGAHHEKLDGTGYPNGLVAAAIPVEARMMTIADIFDALTASDRPYKKAVPVERALDILAGEVKRGKCDPGLFTLFVDGKTWHRVLPAQS